jgi:diacylglycerol kinase family enzyme
MKKKPFISGSLAYLISIFAILIKKKGANLSLELDGKEKHKGPLLLTAISNGKFCGGGLKSNPLGVINDGFMDINIVYNISRLNFLTKLPFYIKGTHIKLKNIEKVIFSTKCKRIAVTPLNGKMRICVDGEIEDAERTEFEIVQGAFDFVVPSKNCIVKDKEVLSAGV